MVVPLKLRPRVLKQLHAAHQGQERSLQRARQCVYWPGMNNDICNVVKSCKLCETYKASQRKEPLLQDERPARPGEAIAADLFNCEGRDYLAITDKYSGWLDACDFGGTISTGTVQRALMKWFLTLGVPNRLTTDNGPQFKSEEFARFCKEWGIRHDKSSPYHHISNGYGEAAVNSAKSMVKKICPGRSINCQEFWHALLEYRNTPKKDGLSPAQRLFGRPMRTALPVHPQVFRPILRKRIIEADKLATELRAKAKKVYDKGAKKLEELKIGDVVRVQHHVTKKWDLIGEITKIQPRLRSYLVKSETGRLYWRNRRYLRPFVDGEDRSDKESAVMKEGVEPEVPDGISLRRGTRDRKQTDFYRP